MYLPPHTPFHLNTKKEQKRNGLEHGWALFLMTRGCCVCVVCVCVPIVYVHSYTPLNAHRMHVGMWGHEGARRFHKPMIINYIPTYLHKYLPTMSLYR